MSLLLSLVSVLPMNALFGNGMNSLALGSMVKLLLGVTRNNPWSLAVLSVNTLTCLGAISQTQLSFNSSLTLSLLVINQWDGRIDVLNMHRLNITTVTGQFN